MRRLLSLTALSLLLAAPAAAQGIMAGMHQDVNEVQKKTIDLARAIPESAYDWRPGPGVRSVREVFLHVAADNYLIPIFLGKPAPASSGVTSDYNTAVAFEKKALGKADVIAALEASFAHVHEGLGMNTDQNVGEKVSMFGQDFTRHRASLLLVGHLHEHLGQLIAYARSNNVVPPWSR